MPIDDAQLDALVATDGPLLYGDPFRDSTRQRQQQVLFASSISLLLAFGIANVPKTMEALLGVGNVSNAQGVALTLGALIAYGLVSYALAVETDWQVYQHSVLPSRLRALAALDALRSEIGQVHQELYELPSRAATAPLTPIATHLAASVKRLQDAGAKGADHDSIVADLDRRITYLLHMINRSRRLAIARRFAEPIFTYVFGMSAIVALYLRFRE